MHTCNGEQIPIYECSRMTLRHSRFIPIAVENTSTLGAVQWRSVRPPAPRDYWRARVQHSDR